MWRESILGLSALALIGIAAPAAADDITGLCTRTEAVAMGSGQQLVRGVGDPVAQCDALTGALIAYTAAGCVDLIVAGELGGLNTAHDAPVPGDGIHNPLGDTVCTALMLCGFRPLLPPEVCPGYE
jgi:hypothetical protein